MPFSREGNPYIQSRAAGEPDAWPRRPSACARRARASTPSRDYTRCRRCGRARAVYRKFGLCRICLREMAHNGYIPGMTKSALVGLRMSMTDPIADFLTRIRNGIRASHETVDIPASKLKREMARILKEQGYIDGYDFEAPDRGAPGASSSASSSSTPTTAARRSRASSASRAPASAPTSRHDHLPKVQGGMGTAIVSTSKGVMTGHEARQQGIGGEVVAHVW